MGLHIARPDGFFVGSGPTLAVREFILFTAEISETVWFRNGEPAPRPNLADDIKLTWLTSEQWHDEPSLISTEPAIARERFGGGGCCLVGRDTRTLQTVYQLWASDRGAYIPWIFKFIPAPAGHLLVFDVWVHPDHRGGAIHWNGAAMACEEARNSEHTAILAGVETHEFQAFAAKYARQGLVTIWPRESLLGIKFFGATRHFSQQPPAHLIEYANKLKMQYP